MQIAYSWLQQYLPRPISLSSLSSILTSIGLEVESIEKVETIPGNLEGLVVGQVISCQPHPNADKLKKTQVAIGNDLILPIVCGAPNVAAGQKIIVATVGTTLYPNGGDPLVIKKAKIRGEESQGMICAEDEMGMGNSHEGIMILPEDTPIGLAAAEYFQLPPVDHSIHIGLTPNRSDANSHIGVARDLCAYQTHHTQEPWMVKYPELTDLKPQADLPFTVTVKNDTSCPRYIGLSIAGITVGSSPEWLVQRLASVGIRSINNIVDVTNFVLHEYGQPLHAFDYDKIAGQQIIVQNLSKGTVFQTLDGSEKKLRENDLMICDAEKGMCMAGVYGGLHSGITESTKNIFIESAYFDPMTIRRTSMHHQLRTDAATHFEKGVDMELLTPALNRAAQLIVDIAGGQIASEIIDHYPKAWQPLSITASYSYINQLCGKNFTPDSITVILDALGFTVERIDEDQFVAQVPANKSDVKQAADLAEEVLRIDGLDQVPMSGRLNIALTSKKPSLIRQWKEKIATALAHSGLQEIVTNSITNSKYYSEQTQLVRMLNSLSSELDALRPALLYSGLEVIAYNVNRKLQDLQLFENGNVYSLLAPEQYKQEAILGIWITGNRQSEQWNQTAIKTDLYYIKGLVDYIFTLSGLKKIQESVSEGIVYWKQGKQVLAKAHQVTADDLKIFEIKQDVFYAELYPELIAEAASSVKISYQELPKFPAMRRDLALVVDRQISYSQVEQIVKKQQWTALKRYELFDLFEHEKLGKDKKSMALSFHFQLNDRTLTDEEVDTMMKELIARYQKELQAIVRE